VAIERADGLVVDRLLAAGHPVVAVDPGAFHAARPRWGAAGAKTDPGDSYKLADYLRTDGHRLRRLEPLDAATRDLQALVRLRDDHVAAKTAASNQLGALLDAHWPGAKQLFFRLASKITLAFLAEFPTPQAAAQLDQAELAAFCRRHAYRGGRHPAELLERLRSAPKPPVGLDPRVLAQLVGAQVQLLATLLATIADLDQAIGNRLGKHPKVGLLARLPRVGQLSHAQLLAELGPILDRASSAEHAAAQAGAARSPGRRGRPAASTFAWPPTTEPAKPCTSSPTTPATAPPGQPSCMPTSAPVASATPKRSGSLGAPGSESSGPAGTPNTAYDPAKRRAEQRLPA
jgi:transposase